MTGHASFQVLPSIGKASWDVAVLWDHLLRERILGLAFATEAEAEFWIENYSATWLSRRNADPRPGGKVVSVLALENNRHVRSIYLVADERGKSIQDVVAAAICTDGFVQIIGSASLTLLQRLKLAPGQIKLMSGLTLTDRAPRTGR